MAQELTLAFAATWRGWARHWGRHIADHGPGRLVDNVAERQCLFDHPFRVLVADADSPLVDSSVVDELHRRSIVWMAVWDPADPRTKELGVRLGADILVEADATAEEFVRRATDVAGETDAAPLAGPIRRPGPRPRAAQRREEAPTRARLVVVSGPVGDEADDVAVEMARAVAGRNWRVIAIDANDVNPGMAQHLGLPVLPNLRIAVDSLRDPRRTLTDCLFAVAGGGFWALGGLADPSQWAEVTPSEVLGVVEELGTGCDVVVAVAGPLAEDMASRGGVDRFGITRALLASADAVVGVGAASPTGLARLMGWLADVRLVAPRAPLHLAITRAPADGFRRSELVERLNEDAGPASLSMFSADPRVERARWNGALARPGPFTKAAAGLAEAVVPGRPHEARSRRKQGRGG